MSAPAADGTAARSGTDTFADSAAAATAVLEESWYVDGAWRMCALARCTGRVSDWGADSLTGTLYLRWLATKDAAIVPLMSRLLARAPEHAMPCEAASCETWSDVPMWDAVAALREASASGDQADGVRIAAHDFDTVDRSTAYTGGACPDISYQRIAGGSGGLKTLETDSNYVKAALLLYDATGDDAYRQRAVVRYAAARRRYLDPDVALYTTYVFDDGATCAQLPHRFFASVNGNMIWNGLELAKATGESRYRSEALATARAVDRSLADSSRMFVDLQAENDVVEPLVEAMLRVGIDENQTFAKAWILRNAGAARAGLRVDGNYGRFVNGPATAGTATAWEVNGGLALQIAAAAIAPDQTPPATGAWRSPRFVAADLRTLPSRLRFTGSAIALVGTVGEQCCEHGHARVFVDGIETFDRTGIWQNKSSAGFGLPGAILFAWRWPHSGAHTLRFAAGGVNAKEGGPFLHIVGYYVE